MRSLADWFRRFTREEEDLLPLSTRLCSRPSYLSALSPLQPWEPT